MLKNQRSRNVSSSSSTLPNVSLGTSASQDVQSFNIQEPDEYPRALEPYLTETETASANGTSSGKVVLGMNETAYVGATHWAAILDDVRKCHPLALCF
jgi:hypothetical protein